MDVVEHTRDEDGVALLDGSLGHLGCTTEAIHPGGDHSIVVGRVHRIAAPARDASPLVYVDHRLTALASPEAGRG
jgi:flavin reductase (DIM6/NTAB) family NADH-FMN oxidoreductase RutF